MGYEMSRILEAGADAHWRIEASLVGRWLNLDQLRVGPAQTRKSKLHLAALAEDNFNGTPR
jgi:hypothetical protein